MFEQVNFIIMQLQRTRIAMSQPALQDFRPDGRDLAYVAALQASLESAKSDEIARVVALNNARGRLDDAWSDAHDLCVAAHGGMRSVYRRSDAVLHAIRRIPKKDQTARDTLARAEVTASLWESLPPMPNTNPPAPFALGALTLAALQFAIDDLRIKIEARADCDTEHDLDEGGLLDLTGECAEFVSALVAQGYAWYPAGSEARNWIDTIPLEAGTLAPLQAEITAATSPVPGVVHLEFSATHATSYTIQTRLESDVEFVTVAEDVTEEFWDATNLPPGNHQYIVLGVNSRGSGTPSDIATVPVEAGGTADAAVA